IDREIDRAAALVRLRADAIWPALPRRGRGAYRAADGRQRAQSCIVGRRLYVGGSDRLLQERRPGRLASYGTKALARVWKAEQFSWFLTKLMHRFPEDGSFERRMQPAELDYIAQSDAIRTAIAENYVGLPL